MNANPNPRLPARSEDDLLDERPLPQAWRDVPPAIRTGSRYEDRDDLRLTREDARPIVVSAPVRPPSALDTVSRGIGALVKLTVLLILLTILWGLVSMVDVGARAPGALGDQIGGAIERGAGAVASAGQQIADAFDPAHPPRQALTQDVEIDELLRIGVGGSIPGSSTRDLTLASIQRRADPSGPDQAVYAVLHGELKQAQESSVLGVTVQSTRDPQDFYLYKGETIRIGQKLYKVNWVSIERQQLALVAYREQDRVAAPLKAEID